MTDFTNQQINPPLNWQDFERLCRDIWAEEWNNHLTVANGRGGQAQHGVDVYGQLNGDGAWQAVQCKGKDGRYGTAVTKKELQDEVDKAKNFEPPISSFILATTAPSDAAIQKVAREITVAHQAQGLFPVTVFSWDEIHGLVGKYPPLIEKHFGHSSPNLARIADGVVEIRDELFRARDTSTHLSPEITDTYASKNAQMVALRLGSGDVEGDPVDEALNRQIDIFRDRIKTEPRSALTLFKGLRDSSWDEAAPKTRFRIITNIGAAYFMLGDADMASKHYLEAFGYADPNDPKAVRNCAVAHLLNGDVELARTEAKRARELAPDDADSYAVLVAVNIENDEVEEPESLVPEKHREVSNVAFTIGNAYRLRGRNEKALEWYERTYHQDKESLDYRAAYGSELLSSVLEKPAASLPGYLTDDDLGIVSDAIEMLGGVWDEIRGGELENGLGWVVANICTALSFSDRGSDARELLPEAIRLRSDSLDVWKLAARLEMEADNVDGALKHLANIPIGDNVEVDLLRSECLASVGKYSDALAMIDSITFLGPDTMHRTAAQGFKLRLIAREKGAEAVVDAIAEAEAANPDDLVLKASIARLLAANGDEVAGREKALNGYRQLGPDTHAGDRYAIADVLYDLGCYQQACDAYEPLVRNYHGSEILERYLFCLFRAAQTETALKILNELPESVRMEKPYRRTAALINIAAGDADKAIAELEAYLQEEPTDLPMRLNWVGVQQRRGDEKSDEQIKSFLLDAPDFPDAALKDQVLFSHLLSRYGFAERGLDLAYELRLRYPDEQAAHTGYLGMILKGDLPEGAHGLSVIESGAAFVVKNAKGTKQAFIIEDIRDGIGVGEEIPSDHPVAQQAIGKSVGGKVEIKLNLHQSDETEILWVGSKYERLFQITADGFSIRFPGSRNFFKVDLEPKNADGKLDLEAVHKILGQRQQYVNEVEELYKSEPYPIAFIANLLGVHPLGVWAGLRQSEQFTFYCCDGTAPENEYAAALLKNTQKGFALDPFMPYLLVDLDIHEEFAEAFEQIGIVQSAIDIYWERIQDLRLNPPIGTMAKVGDSYEYREISPEEIEREISLLEAARNWAVSSCKILLAIGDMPDKWIELESGFGQAFTDTILAANHENLLILSDDQRFRAFAKEVLGVEGVWLQLALGVALERQKFPIRKYAYAMSDQAAAGVSFTSINSAMLLTLAEQENWIATCRVKELLRTLRGEKVNLPRAIPIVHEFLFQVWAAHASSRNKENLTFAVLNGLIDPHRWGSINLMAAVFLRFAEKLPPRLREGYKFAIQHWCEGHFIPFPPQMPDRKNWSR